MSEQTYTNVNLYNVPPELVPVIQKYVFKFEGLEYAQNVSRGKTFVRVTITAEVSENANP